MANVSIQTPNSPLVSVLSFLAAPFRAYFNLMIRIGEANSRSRAIQDLMTMSDEDLAKRGLKRDEIVRHVFKDQFYL